MAKHEQSALVIRHLGNGERTCNVRTPCLLARCLQDLLISAHIINSTAGVDHLNDCLTSATTYNVVNMLCNMTCIAT